MAPWLTPLNSAPLCSPLDVAAPQLSKTKSAFLPHVRNTFTPFNLKDLQEESKGVKDWDRSGWGNRAWSSTSCCEWRRLGRGRLAVYSKTLCGSLLLSSEILSIPTHLSQTYGCAMIFLWVCYKQKSNLVSSQMLKGGGLSTFQTPPACCCLPDTRLGVYFCSSLPTPTPPSARAVTKRVDLSLQRVIWYLLKVPYLTILPQTLWTSLIRFCRPDIREMHETGKHLGVVKVFQGGRGERGRRAQWGEIMPQLSLILPGASLSGGRGTWAQLQVMWRPGDSRVCVWGQSCQHDSSRALTTCSKISGQ